MISPEAVGEETERSVCHGPPLRLHEFFYDRHEVVAVWFDLGCGELQVVHWEGDAVVLVHVGGQRGGCFDAFIGLVPASEIREEDEAECLFGDFLAGRW